MNISWRGWNWQLGLASFLAIGGAIAFSGNCAFAQITPDTTLGNENSTVTSTGAVDAIDGGATRGANLFHSFQEFNVEQGRAAYFTNPASIENIITRVTGTNPSNILGTLGVAGGSANLFLINPNGIIFGSNARLDVGGSFVGTTASGIGFGDRGVLSADNPNIPSLLTVNPSALLFNQIAAPIQNNSSAPAGLTPIGSNTNGLRVPDGQSLLLVGGDISMNGGRLRAFGGRVELGGLAGQGTVGLNIDGKELSLSFPDTVAWADVFLSRNSRVDVEAGGGGSIAINARSLDISESFLFGGIGRNLGTDGTQAGNIALNATEAIRVRQSSRIQHTVGPNATGNAGDIIITTGSLFVTNNSQLAVATLGRGNAGNVIIDARERVSLDNTSSRSNAIFSSVEETGMGKGGDIRISTGELSLTNGAQLIAATEGQGDAGNIIINARNTVSLQGSTDDGFSSLITTAANSESEAGKGGRITISTANFLVADRALVDASTLNSRPGGSIIINANTFYAANGGQVTTTTYSIGQAGSITLNVTDSTTLSGSDPTYTDLLARFPSNVGNVDAASGLFASSNPGSEGKSGDIFVNSNLLTVQNDAKIAVNSQGIGEGGNIDIQVSNLTLKNRALISAETLSNQGGNIEIGLKDILLLRQASRISTNAGIEGAGGDGGNMTINVPNGSIVAVPNENSDITANAFTGKGGKVNIEASSIFGIQSRLRPTSLSDITASSEFGVEGTVELNTLDLDPNSGLVNLPSIPIDTQVSQACTPGESQANSEFVVTGRGGLPSNPGESLSTDAVQIDLVTLKPQVDRPSTPSVSIDSTSSTQTPIVEAQGWAIAANGEVILTANAPTVTPHNSWQKTANCRS